MARMLTTVEPTITVQKVLLNTTCNTTIIDTIAPTTKLNSSVRITRLSEYWAVNGTLYTIVLAGPYSASS